ncbi:MAG: phosphatidylserine decarboxylase [Acidobacteria bacterium]|nr:phosphatidylserine decarboxylase [Acidobacteriota bacterium]
MNHQFVSPHGEVMDERLFGDRIVRFLYSEARERAPSLFEMLASPRMSTLLGLLNFDFPLSPRLLGNRRFLKSCGVDLSECLDLPSALRTPRQIFERRIRYWETRPLASLDPSVVLSPADSRVVVGSLDETSRLAVKGKFFELEELVGKGWAGAFEGGDFAVFRLTPEKYHYNHTPVAGRVLDCYAVEGRYHSCNPGAVVELVTPYSKNKRHVTILDTDVPGGTGVGLVAMVEVVALMIGEIVERYSAYRYENPRALKPGMFVERGAPKSLYRPGSSTDIVLFEPDRIAFEEDLVRNLAGQGAASRFTQAFGRPLVETEVAVRSALGRRREGER